MLTAIKCIAHDMFISSKTMPRHTGLQTQSSCYSVRLLDSYLLSFGTPNNPDLKPMDYKTWGVMHHSIHQTQANSVDKLKQRLRGWGVMPW